MHPIERLRFVARADGVPTDVLLHEAAGALVAFREDPAGLVTACRRLLARRSDCGPLWWMCSIALCAPEPWRELREALDRLDADPTGRLLADALPDDATLVVLDASEQAVGHLGRRGDLRVLVADTRGDAHLLVRALDAQDVLAEEVDAVHLGAAVRDAHVVLLDAAALGAGTVLVPAGSYAAVWVAAGVGRVLPDRVMGVLLGRVEAASEPYLGDWEPVPLALVDRVVGPAGPEEPDAVRARVDCPVAPELLVEGVV